MIRVLGSRVRVPSITALVGTLALVGAILAAAYPGRAVADSATAEPAAADPTPVRVEQAVRDELIADRVADFWVLFDDRPDLTDAYGMADWADRGQYVYDQLTATAQSSQQGLVADLERRKVEFESFWITNAVLVRGGDQATLDAARARTEVAEIIAPREYKRPEPVRLPDTEAANVEWGIQDVRAPEVWDSFRARGEGITVANIDTGVQFDHPALVGQYRGTGSDGQFDHNYNWFDATGTSCPDAPCDPNGHGTHTMGTMVGDDGGENQIGMAPGVTWVATNGCLTCSGEDLIESGEWLLAPTDLDGENARPDLRPHVINNSWGSEFPSTEPFMEDVLEAWEAAGIFGAWANGNIGPFCGSSSSPGSRAIAYSAGAYDINNNIAFFSSRGPGQDGEVKPNIAAPGVNVRSALPGDGYGNNSGTSMAAPHVAGAIALMWSAVPELVGNVQGTRAALDESAIDVDNTACGGEPGDNNIWGEGRLDVVAALEVATRGPIGALTGTVTDAASGDPVPDATVTVNVHGRPQSTSTGTDGGYTFDAVPVGRWPASAEATGYGRSAAQPVTIVEDQTTTADFVLAPHPELAGAITNAQSGEPIAGATVESVTADVRTTTGADGTYHMLLPPGRHTITVTAAGYAPHHAEVTLAHGAGADHSPALIGLPAGQVWESHFFGPGLDDNVLTTTVWDDGSGPALYAGGLFRTAGGQVVNRIARWDGAEWSPLTGPSGTGTDAQVFALTVYEGHLIAGGSFTTAGGVTVNGVARWDGTEWSPLGSGMTPTSVRALTVYDGDLIAAGSFTTAGGVPVNRIARWDGTEWSPLGAGVDSGTVFSLAEFDGDLIVGGNFLRVAGMAVNRVARWDGTEWSPLGGGLVGSFGSAVNDLVVFDGALVAGGSFVQTGEGVSVNRVARWDGSEWSPLAGPSGAGTTGNVNALAVFGGTLVAGGAFTQAGGVTAGRIAQWDGSQWSPLAGQPAAGVDHSVQTMTVFDGALIAAGVFSQAGGTPVNRIARWDGGQWSALTHPAGAAGTGLNGPVEAVTVYDGDVVAAGRFTQAGGQIVNHVARWDGSQWTPLGSPPGVDGYVWALTVYEGHLIVGGSFTTAGGVTANGIARWDGAEWSPLDGPAGTGTNNAVRALTAFDGHLIAGGQFTEAGGVPASRVARWDGTEWSPLGAGVGGGAGIPVQAVTVYDDALIVAGQFAQAGDLPVNNIAQWDGAEWSPLTGSAGTGVNQRVQALTEYDGHLIVGGGFTEAGGQPANWLARWDGNDWSPFALELSGGCCSPWVRSLTVFDGALVAGGVFTEAGGEAVSNIARWDGRSWSPLDGPAGTGMIGGLSDTGLGNPGTSVGDLAVVDADGPGLIPETLVAAGSFSLTGGVANWGMAFYQAPIGVAATSYGFRGDLLVDLTWAGSTADEVDVYRNGEPIVTLDDDGEHTDELGKPSPGSVFMYWVCEAGAEVCSEEAVVDVGPRAPPHGSSR